MVSQCKVNQDVANHYLAKIYLTRGWDLGNATDFTTAKAYAQKVLDRPGNAKTATLTNTIGSATTKQEALQRYLIESGKEFAGEYNGRWPELRRTGMLEYMLKLYNYDVKQQVNLDFNTYKLRPIPEDAITLNEGMSESDQNPGY